MDTINDGLFFINFSMPKDAKSTLYPMTVKIYERDIYGEVTNNGIEHYAYFISQIPTALKIEFENSSEVIPGTSLKAKATLKDQANDKINTRTSIIIKNGDKIIKEEEKQTGEFFELPIEYNQAPEKWIISATSEGINSERMFTILEKEDVNINLVNNTIILTNIGNVPYNKTVSIKINNQTVKFGTYLKVDESKTYILTAPNGEYQVEISSEGAMFTGNTILTGKEIQIKEKTGSMDFIRNPLLWLFIVIIIGAVVFMFMRKNNEFSTSSSSSSSFSKPSRKPEVMIRPRTEESNDRSVQSQPMQRRTMPVSESSNSYQPSQFQRSKTIVEPEKEEIQPRKINPQNMQESFIIDSKIREAIPSSSINGPKQGSSIVCLKIKNSSAMNDSGVKENIQKIIRMAEEKRAVLYNNGEYLFFILTPAITRTMENERTALNIAKSIRDTLENHNKFFKQKLEYGISINNGEIVSARERDILKFMGLGNVIILSKKIASIARNDILLGEAINFKLMSALKTEKRNQEGVSFYSIREMKQQPSEENQKFINGFVKRYRENRY